LAVVGLSALAPTAAWAQGRVLLDQDYTVPASGAASNLYLPAQAELTIDYTVESGKSILLVIITDVQYQAVSAGEQASGPPVLRTVVSGSGSQSVVMGPGTFVVALIAQNSQPSTSVHITARANVQ
jgi:hypothetical protein